MKNAKKAKHSLLNPKKHEISSCVRKHMNEEGFCNEVLYKGCVKEMRRVRLCSIKNSDVRGPIRVFLINWGMMARILNRKDRAGWEKRLKHTIKTAKVCVLLEGLRGKRLDSVNVTKYKNDIEYCFQVLNSVFRSPVAVAKTLHLICPGFFPLWDDGIRKAVSKEAKRAPNYKRENGLGRTPKGYYNFMVRTKRFLRDYGETLSKLSKKYAESKLRVVDQFMLTVIRERF